MTPRGGSPSPVGKVVLALLALLVIAAALWMLDDTSGAPPPPAQPLQLGQGAASPALDPGRLPDVGGEEPRPLVESPEVDPATRRVQGRFVQAADQAPLTWDQALVFRTGGRTVLRVTTDRGRFDALVPEHCDALGTPSLPSPEPDGAGRSWPLPPGDVADLVLPLDTGSVLDVTVLDLEGRPLPGAMVRVDWHEAADDLDGSDKDGRIRLRGLGPESWRLRVRHPFGAPWSGPLTVTEEPRVLEPVVVQLELGATLRGRVVDSQGQDLHDVIASVTWTTAGDMRGMGLGGRSTPFARRTDSDGRFSIAGLPRGPVALSLEQELLDAEGLPLVDARRDPTWAMVEVSPGSTDTEILVHPGCRLSGELIDQGGRSVRGARVRLTREDGLLTRLREESRRLDDPFQCETDAAGRFRMPRLAMAGRGVELSAEVPHGSGRWFSVAVVESLPLDEDLDLGRLALPITLQR